MEWYPKKLPNRQSFIKISRNGNLISNQRFSVNRICFRKVNSKAKILREGETVQRPKNIYIEARTAMLRKKCPLTMHQINHTNHRLPSTNKNILKLKIGILKSGTEPEIHIYIRHGYHERWVWTTRKLAFTFTSK